MLGESFNVYVIYRAPHHIWIYFFCRLYLDVLNTRILDLLWLCFAIALILFSFHLMLNVHQLLRGAPQT